MDLQLAAIALRETLECVRRVRSRLDPHGDMLAPPFPALLHLRPLGAVAPAQSSATRTKGGAGGQ